MNDDFNWDNPALDNQTGSNSQSDFSSDDAGWESLGNNSSEDLWENTSDNNFSNFADFSDDNSWQNSQQQQSKEWGSTPTETEFNSTIREDSPKQFNFGFKQVGVILASVFIVIALILLVLSKVNIKKNEPKGVNSSTTTTDEETVPTDESSSNTSESNQSNTVQNNGEISLLEIPSDTNIDYNGDVLSTNGTVAEKRKLLKDTQVIYCIDIRIVFGSYSQTISYFCNYDSFNKVSKGDIVIVEYQQVSSNCISINSISK